METNRNNKEYQRFKKIFRKGEQICIFGVDWNTHGYITAIEEDGITLAQLKNIKGIKYSWNCFEIICHAGFKVWKSKLTEVANIFEFKISTHLPTYMELKNLPKEVRSISINEIRINKSNLFFSTQMPLKPEEILPNWVTQNEYFKEYFKWKDKDMPEYDDRAYINFKIGENELRNFTRTESFGGWGVDENFTALLSRPNEVLLFPPIVTANINYIISPLHANHIIHHPQISPFVPNFRKEGYNKIGFYTDNLTKLRRNNWDRKTGIGDPYIIEAIPVGYKIWENENGFALANYRADIYL